MILKGRYAASNVFLKQGIELDTEKQCFKTYRRLFSLFTFSDACKPIPKADYILLFKTLYAKCEACSEEDFDGSATFQLSLVYNKNRKLILHEGGELNEMKTMAIDLARALGARIRDSATNRRQPRWIETTEIASTL